MSMADEARAEAERRYPYDYSREGDRLTVRQAFLEGVAWQATRKVEVTDGTAESAALAMLNELGGTPDELEQQHIDAARAALSAALSGALNPPTPTQPASSKEGIAMSEIATLEDRMAEAIQEAAESFKALDIAESGILARAALGVLYRSVPTDLEAVGALLTAAGNMKMQSSAAELHDQAERIDFGSCLFRMLRPYPTP